ncbi:MAG: hypothetical protein HY824_02290 [Acidobacteria bacterium]|nr:hypothetical protein [Acidobacteriota bacterium]
MTVAALLAGALTGCATAAVSRAPVTARLHVGPALAAGRVLVAGFVADRRGPIDLNTETARLVRMGLRSRTSLRIIESEPLPLAGAPGDAVFANAAFWKRVGEEYAEPLILTGTVAFTSVAPHYEERTAGPRVLRLWRPGFSLAVRLVLISGQTGEMIDSASLRPLTAHATTGRERALSLYFQAMDRLMPFILDALRFETSGRDIDV